MTASLKTSLQIHTLANDLGAKIITDPVEAIVRYCEKKVEDLMSAYPECETLSGMLDWIAAKCGTTFCVLKNDHELLSIKQKYVDRGERLFAALEDELATDKDFGVTLKLRNREPWELEFVSVIDCRGDKASRAYFTKWHEIAHLLTLTAQGRLVFKRSHSANDSINPEERLMDILAGRFGFYAPFAKPLMSDEISFETIRALRDRLCPEASFQASLINFSKFWPSPCILIRAELGLKKGEEALLAQQQLFEDDRPQARLRAAKITLSDQARESGFTIPRNMRIPEESAIYRAFEEQAVYVEASEDLCWWESKGRRLKACAITVKARHAWNGVDAFVIPKRKDPES
jgi:hypothetical protein